MSIMTPLQTVLLSSVIFVSGISFGITGFGSGIVFHIGYWALVSLQLLPNEGIANVVVYLTLTTLPVAMAQSVHNRRYIRFQPKLSAIYCILTAVSTVIGIEVLVRNDNPTLTRILGALLFLTFCINVSKDYLYPYWKQRESAENGSIEKKDIAPTATDIEMKEVESESPTKAATTTATSNSIAAETAVAGPADADAPKDDEIEALLESIEMEQKEMDNPSQSENAKLGIPSDVRKYELDSPLKYVCLSVAVLASGFLRGLFGVGGPPMIIYFMATDIDRRIVRALAPLSLGFGSGIPFIVNLLIIKEQFDASGWPTYLAMFGSFVVGLVLGNAVHRFVDQKLFRMALLSLLFCGSINLILVDLGRVSLWASLVLMCAFLFMIVLVVIKMVLERIRLRSPAQ